MAAELMAKRKAVTKKPSDRCECGRLVVYRVDVYGVPSDVHRCRECHEQACAASIREDTAIRYGRRR